MTVTVKKNTLAIGRKYGRDFGGVARPMLAESEFTLHGPDQEQNIRRSFAAARSDENRSVGVPSEMDILGGIGYCPILVRIGIKLANIIELLSAFGEAEVKNGSGRQPTTEPARRRPAQGAGVDSARRRSSPAINRRRAGTARPPA